MGVAMADAYMKRGDVLPALTATLQDADGVPVDLTEATAVVFTMVAVDAAPGAAPKVGRRPGTIGDAPGGRVSYPWALGDTDTAADFYGEFEASWGASAETFPNDCHLVLTIVGDLA